MKIGTMNKGLNYMSFKEFILFAKEAGAEGIQPFITGGNISPLMTKSERAEIKKFMEENGIELPAVCADFGSKFFDEPNSEASLHRLISMIDMAADLGTNIVSTHIGPVPEDENDPLYAIKLDNFKKAAKYADDMGIYLAVETGRDTAENLKNFLLKTGCKSATVNLDPANLVMCIGVDPTEAVYTFGDLIVHTHMKDGVKTGETTYMETALGEGKVDFKKYLKALKDIGYDGYLTIERGGGEDREAEIKNSIDFTRKLLNKI